MISTYIKDRGYYYLHKFRTLFDISQLFILRNLDDKTSAYLLTFKILFFEENFLKLSDIEAEDIFK